MLQFSLWRFEALRHWEREAIESTVSQLAEELGLKLRNFMPPIFMAITGKSSATPLMDSMAVLGPDMTRARLRHALGVIGGVSKKELKRLEKEFKQLGVEERSGDADAK